MNLGAAAKLAGKLVKRRLKISFPKKYAGQFQPIQFVAERRRIDEGRAKDLEWPCRSATFRNICPFNQTHSRINRRSIERRHVWRGHHPWQSGLIEPRRAL